jgi:hypothetical protein
MGLADGIRKHGFVTWHERVLLIGHGWLVLTLLCGFLAFAALEMMLMSDGWGDQVRNALLGLVFGLATVAALNRFLYSLVRAQKTAGQAVCAQCKSYGKLRVVAEDRAATWVRVQCRDCRHEWAIDDLG